MKYLIFSDVHGNLPALEAVLAYSKYTDYLICLGDVVNYGPWSNECVEILDQIDNITVIRGNHEEYFISKECYSDNALVKQFFNICINNFRNYETINKYLDYYNIDDYKCIHTINEEYIFSDTSLVLDNNYIIGHNHSQYKRYINNYSLVSVGSIGQNRKNLSKAEFIIYDTKQNDFTLYSIDYNVNSLIEEISRREYPVECILYYENMLL